MKDLGFFKGQPLFVLDYNSYKILDANEAATLKYGFSHEEFCTKHLADLGNKTPKYKLLESEKNGSSSTDSIWILNTKDGDTCHVQFTYHVFRKQGRPVRLAIAHEVESQIKEKMEERLSYPKIFAHQGDPPLAKITWDGDLNVRGWSSEAEELLGWTEREVVENENFFEHLVYNDELSAARDNIYQAAEQYKNHYNSRGKIYNNEGDVLLSKWYNSLIYDKMGICQRYSLLLLM